MTSRLSLHRLVQLHFAQHHCDAEPLGVWQVQRFALAVLANERVPSCLQSRCGGDVHSNQPSSVSRTTCVFLSACESRTLPPAKLPNASDEVVLEMQRTLHTSIDSWLPPDATLLDSLLHAHLMREQLPISYE